MTFAIVLALDTGCASAAAERHAAHRPTADPPTEAPPTGTSVVSGKLPNGFSYYVLGNADPPNSLSLRLVVKAGTVQEDADQRSAAHFVEHLAFDGSRNFKRRDVSEFIRAAGMSWGADVNAETRQDSTQYRLTVPIDTPGAVAKAFAFLRDVAGNISFEPAEIERERRVLIEEWRTGLDAETRLAQAKWAMVLAGSRYADHSSRDSREDVARATRDSLRRFYKDWYRPDTMALVAAGPIESNSLVKYIEQTFGDLRAPARERPVMLPDVPSHEGLLVKVVTDPELTGTSVALHSRLELPSKSQTWAREAIVQALVAAMMEARLRDGRTDAPFLNIGTSIGSLTRGVKLASYTADVSDARLEPSVRALFGELASASRYGFSPQELARAKQFAVSRSSQVFQADEEVRSEELADSLEEAFLTTTPLDDDTPVRDLIQKILPTITLANVNAWAREHSGTRDSLLLVAAPTGVAVPTELELRGWVREASLEPPPAPSARLTNWSLASQTPTPGKVIRAAWYGAVDRSHARTTLALHDVTSWDLSNGARVIVKPLPRYAGAVSIRGWWAGGTAGYSDRDFVQARFAGDIARVSGAETHDASELYEVLGAVDSSVDVGFSQLWTGLSIDTHTGALETALRVANLQLTAPRQSREGFASWKAGMFQYVKHEDGSPDAKFWSAVRELTNEGEPRAVSMSAADVEQVDSERAYSIWREHLSNFKGATFLVIGAVELERLEPLVETYLASLPSGPPVVIGEAPSLRYPAGKVERTVVAGQAPRSKVLLQFMAPDEYSGDLATDLEIFQSVLQMRLNELLRDDLGDVYSPSVWAWCNREPNAHHALRISFDCAPDNVDRLTQVVLDELGALGRSGVGSDHLESLKLRISRQYDAQYYDPNWWLETLKRIYVYDDPVSQINETPDALARVTSENVSATARRLFDDKHYVRVVLRPKTP